MTNALEMCDAGFLATAPSVRETAGLPRVLGRRAGLGDGIGFTDPYTAAAEKILGSVASIGQSIPSISAAFGQNKQVKEQNKLAQESLAAQERIATANAQASAVSSASWAATARTAAPYVGGAVLVTAIAYGLSKLWKRGRS